MLFAISHATIGSQNSAAQEEQRFQVFYSLPSLAYN